MAGDFIAGPDPLFDNWQGITLIPYITANRVVLGVSTDILTALTGGQTTWTAAYTTHQATQATAISDRQAKDDARTAYVALIRSVVGQMQKNPAVTDTQRAAMKITVPSGTHTPAPIPTTRPSGTVDTSQRLSHKVEFRTRPRPPRAPNPPA